MIIGNYMMMIITAIELAATIGIPQAFALNNDQRFQIRFRI